MFVVMVDVWDIHEPRRYEPLAWLELALQIQDRHFLVFPRNSEHAFPAVFIAKISLEILLAR